MLIQQNKFLLNKRQVSGGAPKLDCYSNVKQSEKRPFVQCISQGQI